MDGNRFIGGLWCSQVLEGLSAYLDGELPRAVVTQVEQHLASCPNCKLFGTDVAAMLASLSNIPHDITSEIEERLKQAIGG